ncbi:FtsL-like putative cell division protein [Viscerimonas tarda]
MKFDLKEIKKQIMHVVSGSILTEDFFLKNTRFMLLIFMIIVLYISNRYTCISKMGEIQTLQKNLEDAKYESLTISTELIGISRQSQLQSLVNQNGLELQTPKEPVFEIEE